MADQPVFFDPSGRRRRRFRLAVAAFIALLLLSTAIFVVSIGAVPSAPLLPVVTEHAALKGLPPPHDTLLRRTRRGLDYYARTLFGGGAKASAARNDALAIGFHAPWDEQSAASLKRHVDQLDWVMPVWVTIARPIVSLNTVT